MTEQGFNKMAEMPADEEIEHIFESVLFAHHDDISKADDDRIGEARDRIKELFLAYHLKKISDLEDEIVKAEEKIDFLKVQLEER